MSGLGVERSWVLGARRPGDQGPEAASRPASMRISAASGQADAKWMRIDDGQCGDEALAAVGADHLDRLSGEPAAVQVGEEAFSRRGALAGRQAEVDDLLLAVRSDAERHQDRAPERAGAGLAGEHHAVEHEHGVDVLQRPAVEGGDGGIQGLGDAAHRGRADAPAEDRHERSGHPAGA